MLMAVLYVSNFKLRHEVLYGSLFLAVLILNISEFIFFKNQHRSILEVETAVYKSHIS